MRKTLLAIAAVGLTLATLSGCSNVSDALSTRHEEYFDTYADAQAGWVDGEIPAWIPTDSTGVRSVTSKETASRIVHVTTKSKLVGECETGPTPKLDPLSSGWTPNTFPSEVTVCGEYSIMEFDGGWFGWYGTEPAPVSTEDPAE